MRNLTFVVLMALGGTTGCAAPWFFTDGSSVSFGRPEKGVLRNGHLLPAQGDGYVVPERWVTRGWRYGTDEIVAAIERAAARVAREYPGGMLGVGDLSRRGGGDVALHKSHEDGRDADLIFYAVDVTGTPVAPVDEMPRYGRKLRARAPYEPVPGVTVSPRWFDVARNWALVRALLEDPGIEIDHLFISERLRDALLDHARAIGESPELIKMAAIKLHQPARAQAHDDHLHLRIRCPASDRMLGCVDEGRVRMRVEYWRGEPDERPVMRQSRRGPHRHRRHGRLSV